MVSTKEIEAINDLIGFTAKSKSRPKTEGDLISISRSGLQRRHFDSFAQKVGLEVQVLETVTRIASDKSMNAIQSPASTERLLEIAMLYIRGIDVLETKENFRSWMTKPNLALGGIKPIDLLDTSLGIQLLNDELTRIEEGIFA